MVTLAACAGPPAEPRSERAEVPAEEQLGSAGDTESEPKVAGASTTSETPLLAVGDIGDCTPTAKDEKVAAVVRARAGKVALLGDIAYDSGTPTEFRDCFDPAWRPMFDRLKPATGNHEYYTEGAAGYFGYFGEEKAGPADKGYYSYDVGRHWRAIVLNSNCKKVGGCQADSPQGRWLASEIAAAGDRHILAYWHAPLYSTGEHGPALRMKPFFSMLYKAGAPIVLSGHDHSYERFRPQNANNNHRARGTAQFVVGTGGRALYSFGERHPNTAKRSAKTYGILRLVLRANSYSWRFVRAAGSTTFSDSGTRNL